MTKAVKRGIISNGRFCHTPPHDGEYDMKTGELKMAKVNIISGFLGAGKTTLIKKLLDGAFAGEKVVLLENEYGEVGIDGGFMKDTGVQITELNSGCICCTLVGDFTEALGQLIDQYHPDRILIEPSGVGKLSDIRRVVDDVARTHSIELSGCATVADVGKCRMYARNFGEFFIDQIESAETIILSRTQMTTEDKIEKAVALLREHNPKARIITTPWDDLSALQMLETIEHPSFLLTVDDLPEGDRHHQHDHDHEHHHDHEHEHDHHHDHDHEHDDHEHHDHDHEEHGHHHHHHDGHHHADEVFEDFGCETAHKYTKEQITAALTGLSNIAEVGQVLRAKGIVENLDGGWIHFDYVPGEPEVREGAAATTGMICVIGAGIDKERIQELFDLA